jgi:prevent-host-death family protein
MDIEWNLAEAKNKFSELFNLVLTKGPQHVHRRKDKVVVISAKEYEKLKGKQGKFKDFLLNGPSLAGLDLKRDTSPPRDSGL